MRTARPISEISIIWLTCCLRRNSASSVRNWAVRSNRMFCTVTESPRARLYPIAFWMRASADFSSAGGTASYSRSMPPSGLRTGLALVVIFRFQTPSMFTETVTRSMLGDRSSSMFRLLISSFRRVWVWVALPDHVLEVLVGRGRLALRAGGALGVEARALVLVLGLARGAGYRGDDLRIVVGRDGIVGLEREGEEFLRLTRTSCSCPCRS